MKAFMSFMWLSFDLRKSAILFLMVLIGSTAVLAADRRIKSWRVDWKTDFNKTNIAFEEIIEGGPAKNGIPSIDKPVFKATWAIKDLGEEEPVITVNIKGDVRAYPVRILMFHEIVNDTVGGVPVSITYCPLCNAALTFERTFEGRLLDFGTTGKLRMSDMVMYDRQTETWWQQFTGEGIVGKYTGKTLKAIPSRIESFALFKKRHPRGMVLVPTDPNMRRYGQNPYVKYDSERWPFLFRGDYNGSTPALARVVAVGQEAWPLTLIREKKQIEHEGLLLTWQAGQNSALDTRKIKNGKDIGNVVVTRNGEDVLYHIPFAFAFMAFNPEGKIYTK